MHKPSSSSKKAIEKTAHMVMCHELNKVNTEHGVLAYLSSSAFTMTAGRQAKISKTLQQPHNGRKRPPQL